MLIDYISIALVCLLYALFCYFVIKYARRELDRHPNAKRLTLLSLLYSLLFGLSIFGSGGEPGFALPATNLIAFVLFIVYSGKLFVLEFIIGTTFFWWFFIYIFLWNNFRKSRK